MSKCQNCLLRLCRKHPLFDHGERAAKLQSLAKDAQKASISALLQSQIERLEAEARGTSKDDNELYKTEMDQERARLARKRKSTSSASIDQEKAAKYASSGLNPAVLSMMIENSDVESDSGDSAASSSSGSFSSGESDGDRRSSSHKSSKRDRRDKKDKDSKRSRKKSSKKDKKDKKEKKDKKDKKSRSDRDNKDCKDSNSNRKHKKRRKEHKNSYDGDKKGSSRNTDGSTSSSNEE